jgi:hypothetical protein
MSESKPKSRKSDKRDGKAKGKAHKKHKRREAEIELEAQYEAEKQDIIQPTLEDRIADLVVKKTEERKKGQRKDFHMKLYKTPKEASLGLALAGQKKSELPFVKCLIQAIFSGGKLASPCCADVFLCFQVFVGFGGQTASTFSITTSVDPGVQQLVFSCLFPVSCT